jgi:hypothetical protein
VELALLGQSNGLGRGTGGPSFAGVSPLVSVWNNQNPTGAIGTAYVSAQVAQQGGTFQYTDRNNIGVWFADRVARSLYEPVRLTVVARGGTSIEQWGPFEQSVPMFARTLEVWGDKPPADVAIWMHGETDHLTPETYPLGLNLLRENLISGGVITRQTILLICGIAPSDKARRDFQEVQRAIPNTYFVSPHSLETTDGVHFTGAALARYGANKCFAAYQFAKARLIAEAA